MHIFMDESGELGFHQDSSKYYCIACLSTENPKPITKKFKRFKGHLIHHGWPKDIEPKAYRLFNCAWDDEIPQDFTYKANSHALILAFLSELCMREFEIDAILINKSKIATHLKTAPFGIKHNYFAGQILVPRILRSKEVHLFVDQRSKERHSHLPFDSYIATRVFTEGTTEIDFHIKHADSHKVYGLSTVDYISWSIFRLFEHQDDRFFSSINDKVSKLEKWYFPRKSR